MARFDVYAPRRGELFVQLQAERFHDLSTRIVAPLVKALAQNALAHIAPEVEFRGQRLVVATHLMFTARWRDLGKPIGTLDPDHDAILRALDVLFTGF